MTPYEAAARIDGALPSKTRKIVATPLLIDVVATLIPLILRYCQSGREIKVAAMEPQRRHSLLVRWRVRRAIAKQNSSVSPKDLEDAVFKAGREATEAELDSLVAHYKGNETNLL